MLIENANSESEEGSPIVNPPLDSILDTSSYLSFSFYNSRGVIISNENLLLAFGSNEDGRISSACPKIEMNHLTEFTIKSRNGHSLLPISAVCCTFGTLYLFSKNNRRHSMQLVYCDKKINEGTPIYLDIGNSNPLALFGGDHNMAAICSEGEIIFINRDFLIKSPEAKIEVVWLPDGEKASSVACCYHNVFVLSSNGRVFSSPFKEESNDLTFSEVCELSCKEIICLSGTSSHCIAVSKKGSVYGYGSNGCGRLCLPKKQNRFKGVSSFTKISNLKHLGIVAAFAGDSHSLFITKDRKVYSCGNNYHGQLLLSDSYSLLDNYNHPIETVINEGATFCIAGDYFSVVFVGGGPPPNSPNIPVHY